MQAAQDGDVVKPEAPEPAIGRYHNYRQIVAGVSVHLSDQSFRLVHRTYEHDPPALPGREIDFSEVAQK